jgi:TolB-like protein/class 3 adenylate cyclase/Tfp pilus assembly protein PilF
MAADAQASSTPDSIGMVEATTADAEPLRDRLTAILAADVAGYSRLMGIDEHATVLGLDAVRSVFRAEIEAKLGRVVDMAGDSVLALFETAAGALAAALAAQEQIEAAAARQPQDRRMRVRVGLHLGDVIVKPDGSVYGNGINVAARLQAMAHPGGICISQTLYDTVERKLRVDAECAGPQSFKNIAEPVIAWHLTTGGDVREGPAPSPGRGGFARLVFAGRSRRARWLASVLAVALVAAGGWWSWSKREPAGQAAAADMRSIAVLPFASMSEDKSNAHFADGMQEDLLTHLAQLGELKVVSRTSVAEYRNTRKNLRQVGAELGVASIVEGSVRSSGGRVRVSVQLLDARTDKHLWAQSYDRELRDIFAIQSELAGEIAKALKVSLTPVDQARLARPPTESLQAYELMRRFEEVQSVVTSGSNQATSLMDKITLLSRATELDPNFALAWARLAEEHARARFWFVDPSDARLQMAQRAIDRALALAPDDITVRTLAGSVYYYGYRDFERAARYFEDLLRIVPHHVETLNRLAWVRRRQGRLPEAIALLERALEIDARNVAALSNLAAEFTSFRDFDRALAVQRRILEMRPGDTDAQAGLHEIEILKTGSFVAYDRWRATVPAGAERTQRVALLDARRAWANRDFDGVSRAGLGMPSEPTILDYEGLPHVLLAKGERSQAREAARLLIREDTKELNSQPANPKRLIRIAFAHAILGERDAALARFREAWAIIYRRPDLLDGDELLAKKSYVHALLGERKEVLAFLRERARRPLFAYFRSPSSWKTNPFYMSLWDDPDFQALVNDPANNAPIPIANQDPPPLALR